MKNFILGLRSLFNSFLNKEDAKKNSPYKYSVIVFLLLFVVAVVAIWFPKKSNTIVAAAYEPPADIAAQPLRVVQMTPQGELDASLLKKEVAVVFNHPMKDLSLISKMDSGVFEIEPSLKGRFRWYGSKVNAFIPQNGLAPSTRYTVKIPKDVSALNGKKLEEDLEFTFTTERFRVEYVSPGEKWISKKDKLFIHFNYPVELEQAKKFISLKTSKNVLKGRSLNIEYEKNEIVQGEKVVTKENKTIVIISLKKSFPPDTSFTVVVDKQLLPQGGNISLAETYKKDYQTYGPLQVEAETDDVFFYENLYRMALMFNNRVDLKTALENIEVTPKATLRQDLKKMESYAVNRLSVNYWHLEPSTAYTFRISQKLTDIDGNKLDDNSQDTFGFEIPQRGRDFRLDGYGMESMENKILPRLPVSVTGIKSLTVEMAEISPESLLSFYVAKENTYSVPTLDKNSNYFSNMQKRVWRTELKRNDYRILPYDYSWYGNKNPGWYAFQFNGIIDATRYDYRTGMTRTEEENRQLHYLLQVTNLAVVVKSDAQNAYVWVRTFDDDTAVANALVRVYDDFSDAGSCETNEQGYCQIELTRTNTSFYKRMFWVHSSQNPKDNTKSNTKEDNVLLISKNQANMWSISPNYNERASSPQLQGAFIFDRRLYRPGDTVKGKAILSLKKDGKAMPLNSTIDLQIFNSNGEKVYDEKKQPTKEGGVSFVFTTKSDSSVGHYRITAIASAYGTKNYNSRLMLSNTFQVEEFRPVAFTVDTKGMQKKTVGENMQLQVSARYLFGLPMNAAPYSLQLSQRPVNLHVEQYPQYVFGDDDYDDDWLPSSFSEIADSEGKLDASGKFLFDFPLPVLKDDDMTNVDVSRHYELESEVKVSDVDKRSVTHNEKAIVFASPTIVGVDIQDRFHSTDKPFEFSVLTLDNNYKPLSAKVEIVIEKKEWKTVLSKSGSGEVQRRNTLETKEVYSTSLSTPKGEKSFKYNAKESGNYTAFIKVKGEKSYAKVNFYAYGKEYMSWNFSDDDRVTLLADKYAYQKGDTARILVQSPFEEATAIVTVEREKVEYSRVVHLRSNSEPLEIPIKKEYIPNVYVNVVLLRARVQDENKEKKKEFDDSDPGRPRVLFGSVNLKVDVSDKYIPLALKTNKEQYAPRQKVQLTITTEPNAEVALAVSDRAVLDIINYHFPDMVKKVYANWEHGVATYSNHKYLVKQMNFSSKGDAPGGKGLETRANLNEGGFDKDSEDGIRKDFRPTAYWKATLMANAQGKIHLNIPLPDNLTTFRMMALAAKDGRYQTAEKEIVVQQPLVLQTSLPRFMRVGDELKIGAVLINQTGKDGTFQVNLESELLQSADENKEAKRSFTTSVRLENGKAQEVTFAVKVNAEKFSELLKNLEAPTAKEVNEGILFKNVVLKGKISAQGNNFKDALTFDFPIKPAPATETVTVSGVTQKNTSEYFSLPSPKDIFMNGAVLQLDLAATAIDGMTNGFDFFKANPYLCLEQRASLYLLSLTSGELLQKMGKKPKKDYDPQKIENLFLGQINYFQNSDGSFRAWKDMPSGYPNVYLTSYVIKVLQDTAEINAKKKSVVRSKSYQRALAFLKNQLKSFDFKSKQYYSYETLSLMLYVLRRAEKATNYMSLENFLLQHTKELSLRSQSYVYISMYNRLGKEKIKTYAKAKELQQQMMNRIEFTSERMIFRENYYNYAGTFYSQGSALGAVLQMLLKTDKENPLTFMLVKEIIQKSRFVWATSNASASLALALYKYHFALEKDMNFSYTAKLAGNTLLSGSFNDFKNSKTRKEFSFQELQDLLGNGTRVPLTFTKNKKDGQLYYNARFSYALSSFRSYPLDRGITLIREVNNVDEKESEEKIDKRILDFYKAKIPELARGEMYLFRYTVVTPKPVYSFMLSEYLPSNMEAVNTSFATEGNSYGRFVKAKRAGESENDEYYEGEEYADYGYSYPMRYDFHDDRVDIRSDYLSAGVHEMYFLARPLVKGKAVYPPAKAWAMYEPDYFGTTSSGFQIVE